MVDVGDAAPEFSVLKAGGCGYDNVEEFTLEDAPGAGPVVLAFYPAACTGGCSEGMRSFQAGMDWFEAHQSAVYCLSVDLPFSQNVLIDREGFEFPVLSDAEHTVIHDYDVVREELFGHLETARRSIFVLDDEGIVRYRWIQADELPDFDDVVEDVKVAVETIRTSCPVPANSFRADGFERDPLLTNSNETEA